MHSPKPDRPTRRSRSTARNSARVLVMLFTMLAGLVTYTGTAQAHGTVTGPATRAYQCHQA